MNKERLFEKLSDYQRANARLDEATRINIDNDIVFDGVIHRFEFTFELSWKLMKMFLEYIGISGINNPRAIIREAYSNGLIEDGEEWIDMMVDRNKSSHLYDEAEAKLIYEKVKGNYHQLLGQLGVKMEKEINQLR